MHTFELPQLAGNPILIPNRRVVGLRKGSRRAVAPSLTVFGSGNPHPSVYNYSWYFNGHAIYSNGVQLSLVKGLIVVRYNTVVLELQVDESVGGIYHSVVNTIAGEMNVSIEVNVEGIMLTALSVLLS